MPLYYFYGHTPTNSDLFRQRSETAHRSTYARFTFKREPRQRAGQVAPAWHRAALLGKKPRAFERRREKPLLESIGEQLLALTLITKTYESALSPVKADFDRQQFFLEVISLNAAQLHYMGLTALFVVTLEVQLRHRLYLPDSLIVDHSCARQIFSAHQDFARSGAVFRSAIKHGSNLFGNDHADSLLKLNDELLVAHPKMPNDIALVWLGVDTGETDQTPLLLYFLSDWLPWYRRLLGHRVGFPDGAKEDEFNKEKVDPTGLEIIVAKSGRIERLISAHINYKRTLLADARRAALKLINSYYRCDEWAPLAGGPSLRARAEQFLDTRRNSIDSDDIVWDDLEVTYDEIKVMWDNV